MKLRRKIIGVLVDDKGGGGGKNEGGGKEDKGGGRPRPYYTCFPLVAFQVLCLLQLNYLR